MQQCNLHLLNICFYWCRIFWFEELAEALEFQHQRCTSTFWIAFKFLFLIQERKDQVSSKCCGRMRWRTWKSGTQTERICGLRNRFGKNKFSKCVRRQLEGYNLQLASRCSYEWRHKRPALSSPQKWPWTFLRRLSGDYFFFMTDFKKNVIDWSLIRFKFISFRGALIRLLLIRSFSIVSYDSIM